MAKYQGSKTNDLTNFDINLRKMAAKRGLTGRSKTCVKVKSEQSKGQWQCYQSGMSQSQLKTRCAVREKGGKHNVTKIHLTFTSASDWIMNQDVALIGYYKVHESYLPGGWTRFPVKQESSTKAKPQPETWITSKSQTEQRESLQHFEHQKPCLMFVPTSPLKPWPSSDLRNSL